MITQVLHCPNCHGRDIVKLVLSPAGKQRHKCRETVCDGRTFILDYAYPGQSRHVKQQIVDLAINGSGVRDTARVLHVSPSKLHNTSQFLGFINSILLSFILFCRTFRQQFNHHI